MDPLQTAVMQNLWHVLQGNVEAYQRIVEAFAQSISAPPGSLSADEAQWVDAVVSRIVGPKLRLIPPDPVPRYDETFEQGTRALDSDEE